MPKRSILTERFRRVSTPDVFRRSSKVEHTGSLKSLTETIQRPGNPRSKSVPDTLLSHPAATTLNALPTEIYAQCLSYVDFEDLSAFRLTCRTTHYLVSEGDIVRQWIASNIDAHRLLLHPPPSPPTFVYLLEQQRRLRIVTDTATELLEYIEHEILRHTLRRANIDTDQYRQGLFGLVKIRLREKMSPLLFTIQRYLELKAAALIASFAPPTDTSTSIQPNDPCRTFLLSLTPAHLLLSHKCMHFLTWLSNTLLARPSYAGSLERTMRGWLSDPLDAQNFRRYFVLGNVGALRDLIVLASYRHRRKSVEAWMRGLEPEMNVHWRERWGGVGGRLGGEAPERKTVESVLGLRLGAEEVWVGEARAVLVERGLLREGEEVESGSPWQTMEFLCDIAGYDVLHTPPSWTTA